MNEESDFDVWFKANMPPGDISVYRAVEIAYNIFHKQQNERPNHETETPLETSHQDFKEKKNN